MAEGLVPPGWHPDPAGVAGRWRWWDGRRWTEAVREAGEPAAGRPAERDAVEGAADEAGGEVPVAPAARPGAASVGLRSGAWTKVFQALASDDWMPAVRLASRAVGLLLAAGAVLTLIGMAAQLLGGGRPLVLGVALSPFVMALAWLGAVEGGAVVATGAVYLGLCYHRAASTVVLPASAGPERSLGYLALGAKSGLVGSGLAVALAMVVFVLNRDLTFGLTVPVSGAGLRILWLLLPGVGLHVLVAAVAVAVRAGVRIDELVTLRDSWRRVGPKALRGAFRVLVVGVGPVLAIAVALQVSWSVGVASGSVAGVLNRLLVSLNQVAAEWVDIAGRAAVQALQFVEGAPVGLTPYGSGSAWMWLTVPALAGGYLAAGVDIARRADNRQDVVLPSLLVGPLVGAIVATAMIGRVGTGDGARLIATALVLASLWGGLTLATALLWRARNPETDKPGVPMQVQGRQAAAPVAGWVPTPALGFTEAVRRVVRGSLDFRGRARRSEFWWWMLFTVPFSVAVALTSSQALIIVLALLFVLPHTAVMVRRLHDLGRSGAWVGALYALLLGPTLFALLMLSSGEFGAGLAVLVVGELVGGVAALALAVFMALPGRPEANAYGPSPAHRWHDPAAPQQG